MTGGIQRATCNVIHACIVAYFLTAKTVAMAAVTAVTAVTAAKVNAERLKCLDASAYMLCNNWYCHGANMTVDEGCVWVCGRTRTSIYICVYIAPVLPSAVVLIDV